MKKLITLSTCLILYSGELYSDQRLPFADMEPEAQKYAWAIHQKAVVPSIIRVKEIELAIPAIFKKYGEEQFQMLAKRGWNDWNGGITPEEWDIWEKEWEERMMKEIQPLNEEYISLNAKMSDLKKMMLTFDEDGNPVCNVDLAKYGLSMPILTPKPLDPWAPFPYDQYTVIFPHETENTNAPSTNATETINQSPSVPPTIVQDTPQNEPPADAPLVPPVTPPVVIASETKQPSPWLYLGLGILAVVGGIMVWTRTNRKNGG